MQDPQLTVGDEPTPVDNSRRDFLRKSVYAAYATPVIAALLVNKVSAANSANNNASQCEKAGGVWTGTCCDLPPIDGSCN